MLELLLMTVGLTRGWIEDHSLVAAFEVEQTAE